MTDPWRVDHNGGPKAGTETHYAPSEAEADSLAADLVRLHGGRAVVWWEGWEARNGPVSPPVARERPSSVTADSGASGPRSEREGLK